MTDKHKQLRHVKLINVLYCQLENQVKQIHIYQKSSLLINLLLMADQFSLFQLRMPPVFSSLEEDIMANLDALSLYHMNRILEVYSSGGHTKLATRIKDKVMSEL